MKTEWQQIREMVRFFVSMQPLEGFLVISTIFTMICAEGRPSAKGFT